MKRSRSIISNESTHTATSLPTKETSKPPRIMPLNVPPHTTTGPPAYKNMAKQRVINDLTSDEPLRGEKAGPGPSQAEKVPPRGTDSKSLKSQAINHPSSAQPPVIQDNHPPSPPKVQPTSGRSSTPPAPSVTKTYSRQTQETALGEPQVPRAKPVPPEKPIFANENQETVLSRTKGGHDPENGQPVPINGSSLVRHSAAKSPSLPIITLTSLRSIVLTIYLTGRRSPPAAFRSHSRTPSPNASEGCCCTI